MEQNCRLSGPPHLSGVSRANILSIQNENWELSELSKFAGLEKFEIQSCSLSAARRRCTSPAAQSRIRPDKKIVKQLNGSSAFGRVELGKKVK